MSGRSSSPNDDNVAARARQAGFAYDDGTPALDAIDCDLALGSVTAILGANGSGKTTLLRLFAGELDPSSGSVSTFGMAPRSRHVRSRVAYLSQHVALDPEMTARETLEFMAALHGLRGRRRVERLGECARQFAIERILERRIDRCSGGEKRRLHLAAGLVHDPTLILLDEPAAGLDPDAGDAVWQFLSRARDLSKAAAIVTHDFAAAEAMCDRVLLLDSGRVLAAGHPKEIVALHGAPILEVTYLRAIDRPEELAATLRRLSVVRNVHYRDRTLFVDLEGKDGPEREVVACLDVGAVERLHLRRASLRNALARLNGNWHGGLRSSKHDGNRA